MRTSLSIVRVCLLVLLGLLFSQSLRAETSVTVEAGWGGKAREGTWTPVFIRVADPVARNAVIELRTPHDSSTMMDIIQPIAIGNSDQTYVIYAPLVASWNEPISLKIRDAATGKTLYDKPILDPESDDYQDRFAKLFQSDVQLFIGSIAGRGRGIEQIAATHVQVGLLRQFQLPRSSKGYTALDVLVLNQPDFTTLDIAQQTAIADWVRAGGKLVIWFADDPIPPSSPLVELLPCRVGDLSLVTLSPEELDTAGLSLRFARVKIRTLITKPVGAKTINLLGRQINALNGQCGLGSVTVLPLDGGGLDFQTTRKATAFWSAVLEQYIPDQPLTGSTPSYGRTSQIQSESRAAAAGQVIDLLGDVPGVGTFGFKYVAMVLIGMMVIVGPVDWLVLRWMGRQPWTWVTTIGWIGLITTGAVYIGTLFRSGDLYFRTLQVIDQVDGAAVARTDVIGVYSPKSDDYQFLPTRGGWWEPMTTERRSYSRNSSQDMQFRQDGLSNTPAEMRINVWNLRFLTGQTIDKGDAVIATELQWVGPHAPREFGTPARLTGTITNLGSGTLNHLWLRMLNGTLDLATLPNWPAGGLPPKATLSISNDLQNLSQISWSQATPLHNYQNNRYNRHGDAIPPPLTSTASIVIAAGNLSDGRSQHFERALNLPDHALIYGLSESPAAAVKIAPQTATEKHWLVLRAIVPIGIAK